MTFTFSGLWIPFLLTVALLVIMLRPYKSSGDYDFGSIFRVFWLFPVFIVWCLYFWLGWKSAQDKIEKLESKIEIKQKK